MGDRIGVQLPLREIYLSLTNHPGQLSLATPSWVGAMSTGQRAVMLCDWGVKADMVLFAGNTAFAWTRYTNRRLLYFTSLYFTSHDRDLGFTSRDETETRRLYVETETTTVLISMQLIFIKQK